MTGKLQVNSLSTLYDEDFMLWLDNNINLLKDGKFNQLDLDNLIEELEDLLKNNKRELRENLTTLLRYLLKYKYLPQKRLNNWRSTIRQHRRIIQYDFKDSPSLRLYLEQIFTECYEDAKKYASLETRLSLSVFPFECPFSQIEVLNEEFLPE